MEGNNNYNSNVNNVYNGNNGNYYPNNGMYPNNQYNNYNNYNNQNINPYSNYEEKMNNINKEDNTDDSNSLTIKKVLISIVIIVILVLLFIVLRNLTNSYNMSIYLNGADTINENNMKCKSNIFGHCYLTLPDVKRNDGEVLGYASISFSQEAEYKIGEEIEMLNDMNLYVVSRKQYKLDIDTSNIDELSVSSDKLSCYIYNSDSSVCEVVVPQFNKRGHQNDGYSETKDGKKVTIKPGESIKSNRTLYPVYSDLYNNKNIEIRKSIALNNSYVDIENGCSSNGESILIENIKKIEKDFPFLFHNEKIIFHGDEDFYRFFDETKDTHGLTFGINDSIKSLSIRCGDDVDFLPVLVHELAHSFDYYYKSINGKMLSDEEDVKALHSKYLAIANSALKNNTYSINDKPLRYYAYLKNRKEFFAELIAFYYINYIDTNYKLKDVQFAKEKVVINGISYDSVKEGYFRGNYPDDMKKVAEKYICLGNNDFNKSKCA